MHIAPYKNSNKPIVDVDNEHVPLNYFNIVKVYLKYRNSTKHKKNSYYVHSKKSIVLGLL